MASNLSALVQANVHRLSPEQLRTWYAWADSPDRRVIAEAKSLPQDLVVALSTDDDYRTRTVLAARSDLDMEFRLSWLLKETTATVLNELLKPHRGQREFTDEQLAFLASAGSAPLCAAMTRDASCLSRIKVQPTLHASVINQLLDQATTAEGISDAAGCLGSVLPATRPLIDARRAAEVLVANHNANSTTNHAMIGYTGWIELGNALVDLAADDPNLQETLLETAAYIFLENGTWPFDQARQAVAASWPACAKYPWVTGLLSGVDDGFVLNPIHLASLKAPGMNRDFDKIWQAMSALGYRADPYCSLVWKTLAANEDLAEWTATKGFIMAVRTQTVYAWTEHILPGALADLDRLDLVLSHAWQYANDPATSSISNQGGHGYLHLVKAAAAELENIAEEDEDEQIESYHDAWLRVLAAAKLFVRDESTVQTLLNHPMAARWPQDFPVFFMETAGWFPSVPTNWLASQTLKLSEVHGGKVVEGMLDALIPNFAGSSAELLAAAEDFLVARTFPERKLPSRRPAGPSKGVKRP